VETKAFWRRLDEWRIGHDGSHVEEAIEHLNDNCNLVRESVWDYLRAAKHFTPVLVGRAKEMADSDTARCVREAALQYVEVALRHSVAAL
jgi:hypothetical protein